MPDTPLGARLAQPATMVIDGAMGTELEHRGAPMDHAAWSARAILTHPGLVRDIHLDYLRAGAELTIANTFGTSRHVLERAGLGGEVASLNRRAVALAREARDRFLSQAGAPARPVWIAGSLSSFVAAGDLANRPAAGEARASYREQAELLAESGVDLIILEMLRDREQSEWMIEAAASTGLPLWYGFTCELGPDGRTPLLRGRDRKEPLAEVIGPLLALHRPQLVAVMHCDIEATGPALAVAQAHWAGSLGAYPNSGRWANPNWIFDDVIAPPAFVAAARGWVAQGVRVVGGCCGLGPEHIAALAAALAADPTAATRPEG